MKQIIILLSLIFPIFSFSQGVFKPGVSLVSEYSINSFDTKGMNSFVRTFNDFWGEKLSEPYDNFSGKEFSHLNFGINFRVLTTGKIGYSASTGFLIGGKKYQHHAQWIGGVQNELAFKVRDIQWTFTNGIHFNNRIFLESYIDANIRRIELKHYTIYQDGSKSLSSEYKLNGLYTGRVASLDVGFFGGLRIKNILLFAKASWALPNFPPAKGLVALDDYDSNNLPSNEFPADYGVYGTDPIRFVEEDLGVKTDDFEGFRLALGIEYIFGAK